VLLEHDWPGNVRELDNVLRASAVLAEGAEITPEVVRGVMAQRRSLRRTAARAPAIPRAARLMDALGDDWLSVPDLASRLGVSVRTINRDLERLVGEGSVVATGSARARRYARTRGTSDLSR
jgi:transcriptional regulator of acetoin/glycerol metabolism